MKIRITTPALLAMLSIRATAVVNIDWVTVGDPGNAPNPVSGGGTWGSFGTVNYTYQIGKYEVTISQYAEFLNAVAKSDPYGLWRTEMQTDMRIAGIIRSGTNGNYTYSVIGSGLRPIAYTSWFNAARFANWMHNGQGQGSTETGAYSLNGATSGSSGPFYAEPGATVRLPSMDEWHKAAYYDPTKDGGVGGYWLHANQSDTITGNTVGAVGAANYYDGDYALTQIPDSSPGQNYLTEVGAYNLSSSYYGTFDQAGNLFEWTDQVRYGTQRGLWGGFWGDGNPTGLAANSGGFGDSPNWQSWSYGFRLASAIPEPTTGLLATLGIIPLLSRRRKA